MSMYNYFTYVYIDLLSRQSMNMKTHQLSY